MSSFGPSRRGESEKCEEGFGASETLPLFKEEEELFKEEERMSSAFRTLFKEEERTRLDFREKEKSLLEQMLVLREKEVQWVKEMEEKMKNFKESEEVREGKLKKWDIERKELRDKWEDARQKLKNDGEEAREKLKNDGEQNRERLRTDGEENRERLRTDGEENRERLRKQWDTDRHQLWQDWEQDWENQRKQWENQRQTRESEVAARNRAEIEIESETLRAKNWSIGFIGFTATLITGLLALKPTHQVASEVFKVGIIIFAVNIVMLLFTTIGVVNVVRVALFVARKVWRKVWKSNDVAEEWEPERVVPYLFYVHKLVMIGHLAYYAYVVAQAFINTA